MPLPIVFDNAAYAAGFFATASGVNGSYNANTISPFEITLNGTIAQPGDSVSAVGNNGSFNYTLTALGYDDSGSMAFSGAGTTIIISNSAISVGQLFAYTESNLGDYAPVCFVRGTLIATASGPVAIEYLSVDDLLLTSSGEHKPVRWIGHRRIGLRNLPQDRLAAAQPIRISRDAFGAGRPARDLFVSPGHAVCVDMLGEVLIPAGMLVNGTTITQVELDEVEYWHVELEGHEVILGEGLPCESYIDCDNRAFFKSADGAVDAQPKSLSDYCRPFFNGGSVVEAVRERLRDRAMDLGWEKSGEMDIHLLLDGRRLEPALGEGRARFLIPAGTTEVRLRSNTFLPENGDARRLGLSVSGLRITDGLNPDGAIPAEDERLHEGFYPAERDGDRNWRWTNGEAVLPGDLWAERDTDMFLTVEFDQAASFCWVAPPLAEDEVHATTNVVEIRRAG